MRTLRRSAERGHADHGWLKANYSFSFASYNDPAHMGFRSLRVINQDTVAPRGGFDTHPHRDMEIITYIVAGQLEHRDSLGHGAVLRPGEVQRISAGTGISHAEFNPSPAEPVQLLQIWIKPSRKGVEPSYDQRAFPIFDEPDRLHLVVSPDGREGSIPIHADASLYAGRFSAGASARIELAPGRAAWVQVVRGEITVNGTSMGAGDGLAIDGEPAVELSATSAAEVLVFDLA